MKAWEKNREIIENEGPVYLIDDNEQFWEEQNDGPEKAQDGLTKVHFSSQVPGSRAHESIFIAAVQATENKGMKVDDSWIELYETAKKAYEQDDMATLRRMEHQIYQLCYKAKKDETSDYWKQTFYDTFEDYEKAIKFPQTKSIDIDASYDKFLAGWLGQIIGGAYGTCLEGYLGSAIKEKYDGEVTKYVRKPNTYNDDITYELALIEAYKMHGKNTTAEDIAGEWVALIPSGWSAEEWALNNLKAGLLPPASGKQNNPFNEWIGAQMRGAVCGQIYPGNPLAAAKAAWDDASISHNRNGILGEVFNAIACSLAFVYDDTRKLVEDCIELIPEDSEYGKVIRFALKQCKEHNNYNDAWLVCEQEYRKYNWVHTYPNAAVQVIALYYGENDFTKTLSICGGCGQDVDCNAAQMMTVFGSMFGTSAIPEYWTAPFGDRLDTYIRGLKVMSISKLASDTQTIAKMLIK